MTDRCFRRSVRLDVSADVAFAWHARPGALERLMPPWEKSRLVRRKGALEEGATVHLEMRLGPLALPWHAEHGAMVPGRRFHDRQVRGPFARWEHTHELTPAGDDASELEDRVSYRLPFGPLGALAAPFVRREIERLFAYRHDTTRCDLAAHARARSRGAVSRPAWEETMKIAVTGATGLVGSQLTPFLTTGGHEVVRLTRTPREPSDLGWNPVRGEIDEGAFAGVDAVVHLAGEGIADGRWNDAKKERIRRSRVDGTRLVAETLAGLEHKPRVLVCASAIGYYGSRGDEVLSESSSTGDDFLANVCRQWEAAAEPARAAGIRVVHLRFGVVLSPRGGALAKMLLPFKMGGGGVLGSGEQYMSWVGIDDAVGAIHHALTTDDLDGPVNVVSPSPVTNRECTKTLGHVLGRPTILPMPAFAARLAFGEMADALLLSSTRVLPKRLVATGYEFRHPTHEGALRHLLGRALQRQP